jgi:nucleotide-binding universal stress UspA family protein
MIKILVPVDFSETSEKALAYACQIFGSTPIEVTILHVYGTHSTALLMKSIDNILIKDANENLKTLLEKTGKTAPHVQYKTQLVKGYAVQTIISYGNSRAYNLIVMGTKGASGLKEVFLGSIAGGVITKTKAPVIVVPHDYNLTRPRRTIFALNNLSLLERTNLDALNLITKSNDGSVIALHVAMDAEDEIHSDQIKHGDLNFKVKNIQGSGNTSDDINAYLDKYNADLLCLIRSKKNLLARIFNDSVTLEQTFNSHIPLLILHEEED